MRPPQRSELAHRGDCESDTATLWRARMYWQAMRNTAGLRAKGKCPRLTQASRRQESIRPSLKSLLKNEVAGARHPMETPG